MIEKLKNPASGNWLLMKTTTPAALTRQQAGITGSTSKAGYWSGEDGGGVLDTPSFQGEGIGDESTNPIQEGVN